MTEGDSRQSGFVLLAVLGMMALISAIAIGLLVIARDGYSDTRVFLDATRARFHADNVLMRVLAAIGAPDDPMHSRLLVPGAVLVFKDHDVDVEVRVEFESGKIDLNRADPAFIRNALVALGTASAETVTARVITLREAQHFIAEPHLVLTGAERFDPALQGIERYFTGVTGARGISPRLAERLVLAAIPGISSEDLAVLTAQARGEPGAVLARLQEHLSPARSIYTIKAKVVASSLPPVERALGLALHNLPMRHRHDLSLLWWRG